MVSAPPMKSNRSRLVVVSVAFVCTATSSAERIVSLAAGRASRHRFVAPGRDRSARRLVMEDAGALVAFASRASSPSSAPDRWLATNVPWPTALVVANGPLAMRTAS